MLLLLLTLLAGARQPKIDTVVVLMLENRSFDHMLGFLKRSNADIDGCLPGDPRCSCPVDPTPPPRRRPGRG